MKIVDSRSEKRLNAQYSDLSFCLEDYAKFAQYGYSTFAISVFDHWLSNEEAATKIGKMEGENHEKWNSLRYSVVRQFASDGYIAELNELGGLNFFCFESESERDELIRRAIFQEDLIVLCKVATKVVICVGHDYTDYIYYKDGDNYSDLTSLVLSNGLYCLPNSDQKNANRVLGSD